MKTIKKVEVKIEHVETIPDWLTQGTIYVSSKYFSASHMCLCGCGNLVVTPLHMVELFHSKLINPRNKTIGWDLKDELGKITMTPSIGNYNLDCKSHYIITNGKANFV